MADGAGKTCLRGSWSLGLYGGLAAFSLAGSYLCRVAHLDPTPIARPAAMLTLGAGCFAAFEGLFRADRRRAAAALALVFSVGLVSELAGLRTGFPFGRYQYTERWWPVVGLPGIGQFPLQLPFAWMLVAGCSYLAVAGRWWSALAAALIAAAVDQAMEPAMTGPLRYWVWIDKGPLAGDSPAQNAAGWFAVSLLAAMCMQRALGRAVAIRAIPAAVLAIHLALVLGIARMS